MLNHMKTTLKINDRVMTRLKQEAARRGCTMSELVEGALRTVLEPKPAPRPAIKLPAFRSGGLLVDIADREALYEVMKDDE
jgi:hypothetical protein